MSSEEKDVKNTATKITKKASSIFDFIWFVLLAFLLVGSLTQSQNRMIVAILVLLIGWVANEIISRGIAATNALFFSKKNENDNINKEE